MLIRATVRAMSKSKMSMFIMILATVAACGIDRAVPTTLSGDGIDAKRQPIYGGSAPDSPFHAAVVGLHKMQGKLLYTKPFCSGTLISPQVVVTAAHCVEAIKGGKVAVYFGDDPSVDLLDSHVVSSEAVMHPGYSRSPVAGYLNDIGLIRLRSSAAATPPVPHLPAANGFTAADVGQPINFAGFGEVEDGSWGIKLQADSLLGGLGCTVAGCPSFGGDADYLATQVSYSQAAGTGPCFGDSGGPLFVDRGGTTYVGAVTSYGDSSCSEYGASTRTDAYGTWIEAFIAGGGGDGGGGGGGGGSCDLGAKGDSCTADDQCCSGKCRGPSGATTCK